VLLAWRPGPRPLLRGAEPAVLALRRLTGEEVALLAPDPALAPRLHAETEGVPLLLVEVLAALAREGSWALPAGARDVLRARLHPLRETARQLLAAAAVLGRGFELDAVRAVSGRGEEETVGALEELVGHGLLEEGPAAYEFSHEKLREVVYADTSLARRRLLHGRAADALAPRGASPAVLARHLRLAGRERDAAAAHARAAAQARALHAHADALEHLRAALALGHPDRAGLHTALGDVQTALGDYGGAVASYQAAAAEGGPLAALEHRLGDVHLRRGEWAAATAHLRAALAATPEDRDEARARLHADLALAAHEAGDHDGARELARRALARADAAGDARAQGRAHNVLGLLATSGGDLPAALGHLGRALALAEAIDDPAARVAALNNLALAHRARGELEPALELTRRALAACAAVGDRHREAALRNHVADLLHAAGRREEAMAELKRAVALFAEVGAQEREPGLWMLSRW